MRDEDSHTSGRSQNGIPNVNQAFNFSVLKNRHFEYFSEILY